MDLQTIDNWPVGNYNFTGNGSAAIVPSAYVVNMGTLALPAGTVAGNLLWVDGFTTPFGTAPPNFNAFSINAELSEPAVLKVDWTSAGTTAPFSTLTATSLSINLSNANYVAGVIVIGSESIDLKALSASPQIVPQATPPETAGIPAPFLPLFAIGGLTGTNIVTTSMFNAFSAFTTQLPLSLVAATPALHFVATGAYNRGNNTFTATTIDVVN
jgi:hypothetical protein